MNRMLLAVAALGLACAMGGCFAEVKDDVKTATTRFTIEADRLADAASYRDAYDRDCANPDKVLALFFNALLLIEQDEQSGTYTAVYMCREGDQWKSDKSFTGVVPSQMASEGYKRIAANGHLVRSYCGADGPPGYALKDATKIRLDIKQVDTASADTKKYFVFSTGKDAASPVTLRNVDGKWVIEEWSSIQTGVRKR
ncbi:MAG: hypothetical protein IT462_06465 [Planctomycetes bacterium]|nr:hypothetical protein [Planctomycetota bacterium]